MTLHRPTAPGSSRNPAPGEMYQDQDPRNLDGRIYHTRVLTVLKTTHRSGGRFDGSLYAECTSQARRPNGTILMEVVWVKVERLLSKKYERLEP